MSWDRLRLPLWLRSAAPPPFPVGTPPPGAPVCRVWRGPVRSGFARCYQCERQARFGRGLLADAVVPISYALKGTAFADDLWRYKSMVAPAAAARASVLALLLAFLADHGPCVWRQAAMPPPSRLAGGPSGWGRPRPPPPPPPACP